MAHVNRQNIGKFWPIPRKGTKYLAVASHNKKNSIPLVVIMREILGLVKTKKELQKAINEKMVKINGKEIRDVNYPMGLFDILSVGGKDYQAGLSSNKKMVFEEVKGIKNKVVKIRGKKIIGKDKIQLNLMDGCNILSKEKAKVGDSAVISFEGKLEKVIPMEKGNVGFVIEGKHAGHKGKIDNIVERGGKSLAQIIDEDKNKVNVWVKNVIVMDK
jgi:small subunit ribosomal protein S4e